jgi:hypothetical protein
MTIIRDAVVAADTDGLSPSHNFVFSRCGGMQTRKPQELVAERQCWFKSSQRHQCLCGPIGKRRILEVDEVGGSNPLTDTITL